nr:MAG TPA: hypothetical protein [Caudoviricetes sp.]
MAGIIVYIPFSVISFIGSVESLDGIFIPPLVFSTNEIPISPPTLKSPYLFVSAYLSGRTDWSRVGIKGWTFKPYSLSKPI